jgi:hypothetical protein
MVSRIGFHEKKLRQPLRAGLRFALLLLELRLLRVGGLLTGLLPSAKLVRCLRQVPSSMTTPRPGYHQIYRFDISGDNVFEHT